MKVLQKGEKMKNIKENIEMEDLDKIDIRVGTILLV